jgi:hypothetical protein
MSPPDVEALQRLLQEAEARAEEAERKAEEADRKAEEADRKAEEEKRKAEEEKRKAEEADRKAEEEKRKAEEEKRKAEEEKRKAEEADRKAEEADRKTQEVTGQLEQVKPELEEAERKTQLTTLEEFLRYYHIEVARHFKVADRSQSTQGDVTNPRGRYYPTRLRHWDAFPGIQRQYFDLLYSAFQPPLKAPLRRFRSVNQIEGAGLEVSSRICSSEKDLDFYEPIAVENPVTAIISELTRLPERQVDPRITVDGEVIFKNHANTLNDSNEEVQTARRRSKAKRKEASRSGSSSPTPKPTDSDSICFYKNRDGRHTTAFIIEHKPPHKLPIDSLRTGLRLMELVPEVLAIGDKGPQHGADKLIASVMTQTFDYMINLGLEYSYLTTGESYVFLWIQEADPETLYYHLAVPKDEAGDDEHLSLFHTAVGQVVSFTLMALRSKQRRGKWRKPAKKQLDERECNGQNVAKWQIVDGDAPTDDEDAGGRGTREVSGFESPGIPVTVQSCYGTRSKGVVVSTCREDEDAVMRDDYMSHDSSGEGPDAGQAAGTANKRRRATTNDGNSGNDTTSRSSTPRESRQYCTQACLLGLKRGWPLDDACPNVSAHRAHGDGARHAVDARTFAWLVREQLARDLDDGCEPLDKQGARGALFKITLAAHGYTLVAKGTVSAFVPDLRHEGRVYRRLERIQGEAVPVCLGNIDLVEMYYLDLDVEIVHMLLMSWAGEVATEAAVAGMGVVADLGAEVQRTAAEVRGQGVVHGDDRAPNRLWNVERRRVMLIDFERSTLLPSPEK